MAAVTCLFLQAEDGIRGRLVVGGQACARPIGGAAGGPGPGKTEVGGRLYRPGYMRAVGRAAPPPHKAVPSLYV